MNDDHATRPELDVTPSDLASRARNGDTPRPAEAVSLAVEQAAALVGELNQRLDKLNEWAARERALELGEQQLGALLAEAEAQAQRAVADARELAQELVSAATEEASRIRAGVGLPRLEFQVAPASLESVLGVSVASPIDEVRALRVALVEFSRTNSALLKGIADLVEELARRALPGEPGGRSGAHS